MCCHLLEHSRNAEISLSAGLKLDFLPVKMQEHSDIFRLMADVLTT